MIGLTYLAYLMIATAGALVVIAFCLWPSRQEAAHFPVPATVSRRQAYVLAFGALVVGSIAVLLFSKV